MSAFIDPEATEVVDLPVCYCPGAPHDHDTVTIRTQYGYGDLLELTRVHMNGRLDPMAERAKLLELGIKGWSFTDEEGPVEVNPRNILRLSQAVVEPIVTAIDLAYNSSTPPVPNASSGRSQPSSPARSTASTNRATRRRAKR
jgi:hypothetical protein